MILFWRLSPAKIKRFQSHRQVHRILQALDDRQTTEIRGCAAAALGELRASEAVDALLGIFERANEPVELRQIAAVALGDIGDARAVPTLSRALLAAGDSGLASAVSSALAKIARAQEAKPWEVVQVFPDGRELVREAFEYKHEAELEANKLITAFSAIDGVYDRAGEPSAVAGIRISVRRRM